MKEKIKAFFLIYKTKNMKNNLNCFVCYIADNLFSNLTRFYIKNSRANQKTFDFKNSKSFKIELYGLKLKYWKF